MTSASDNKTRVWNLLVALDPTQEEDKGKPRLLATLTDHFEGVNAARFSRCVTSPCSAACMHVLPGIQRSALPATPTCGSAQQEGRRPGPSCVDTTSWSKHCKEPFCVSPEAHLAIAT